MIYDYNFTYKVVAVPEPAFMGTPETAVFCFVEMLNYETNDLIFTTLVITRRFETIEKLTFITVKEKCQESPFMVKTRACVAQ